MYGGIIIGELNKDPHFIFKLIKLGEKKRFKVFFESEGLHIIKYKIKKHSITNLILNNLSTELGLDLDCNILLVKNLSDLANLETKLFSLEDSWVRYECGICNQIICFSTFVNSLNWVQMFSSGSPVPRLINIQYKPNAEGYEPIYRHPADELPIQTPWSSSPLVELIAIHLSQMFDVEFNHVLIQLYRSGSDNISSHSDKTLDIIRGTPIVNYTLGATRFLRLCLKADHTSWDQFALSNDSIFVLGPKTNMLYTHEIRADKRLRCDKLDEEIDFDQQRISFTFRCIGTFKKPCGTLIGQGAVKDLLDTSDDTEKLITAFGIENKSSDFDWNTTYGSGFKSFGLKKN